MRMIIDYFHFPTRDGAINLEKLRLPAKTRAIEKFQSRVSLWTYVGDLEAYLKVPFSQKGLMRLSFLQTGKPIYFPEVKF